jgi:hypothetical protein
MGSHFRLFDPYAFFLKSVKVTGLGACAGLVPFALALAAPQFQPQEHIGFPVGSMGDNYLSVVQTGDLLFFNSPQFVTRPVKWFFSQLQKKSNFSEFEHLGVIVWHPKQEYPYVIEKTLFGTIATPFEDRIGWTRSQDVMLRTLHLFRDRKFQERAQEFVKTEMENHSAQNEGALTRGLRWTLLLKSLLGSWAKDSQLPRLKPGTTSFSMHSMGDILNLQYSSKADQKEMYDHLLESTSKRGNVLRTDLVPMNRVLRYAEIIGTLKTLKQIETRLELHFFAEKHNNEYNLLLHQYKVSQASSSKSKLLIGDVDGARQEPQKPHDGGNLLETNDLRLLLQKRELLYNDFDQQYTDYRKLTIDLSRFGVYMPLNNDTYPAFPSVDLVVRLYQSLNLLPLQFYHKDPNDENTNKVAPSDVEKYFPICLPEIVEKQRSSEFDLSKFDFKFAFEVLTHFCPTSREYKPYNFRQNNPMYLAQGVLGDEQYIVNGFNKPPIEYRTGSLSTPAAKSV